MSFGILRPVTGLRIQALERTSTTMEVLEPLQSSPLEIARFVPTPLEAVVELDGIAVRLLTNCQALLDRLLTLCRPSAAVPSCVWTVVTEDGVDPLSKPEGFAVQRLSHRGLAFVGIGHRSFLACDQQAREGVSFISESLVHDERAFAQHFLPALTWLLQGLRESV